MLGPIRNLHFQRFPPLQAILKIKECINNNRTSPVRREKYFGVRGSILEPLGWLLTIIRSWRRQQKPFPGAGILLQDWAHLPGLALDVRIRDKHQGNADCLLPCSTTKERFVEVAGPFLPLGEKGKPCVSCMDSLADDLMWNYTPGGDRWTVDH